MAEVKKENVFKSIYRVIFNKSTNKIFTYIFDILMLILTACSTALLIFELIGVPEEKMPILEIGEFVLLGLFAIEWLLHLLTCYYMYPDAKPRSFAIHKWIFSFSSVIDIICLLTLFVMFIPNDSKWRLLKCVKFIKLLKVPEYLWFIHRLHNYHSHTKRCGHAKGEDINYVYESIFNSYDTIGFSDHVPFKDRSQPGIRQDFSMINDYCDSVNKLKKQFKHSIKIYLGYEAEYYEEYDDYYKELFDKYHIEYLILGQHCKLKGKDGFEFYMGSNYKNDYDNLKEYVDAIIKAMSTGYFLYVAHPDIIMNCFSDHSDPKLLDEMKRLISASIQYDCPLEINLGGAALKCNPPESNYLGEPFLDSYPYEEFFKLAGEMGAKVVIGVDAHSPLNYEENEYKYAKELVKKYKLNLVKKFNIDRK